MRVIVCGERDIFDNRAQDIRARGQCLLVLHFGHPRTRVFGASGIPFIDYLPILRFFDATPALEADLESYRTRSSERRTADFFRAFHPHSSQLFISICRDLSTAGGLLSCGCDGVDETVIILLKDSERSYHGLADQRRRRVSTKW